MADDGLAKPNSAKPKPKPKPLAPGLKSPWQDPERQRELARRPKPAQQKHLTPAQKAMALQLLSLGKPVPEICATLDIGRNKLASLRQEDPVFDAGWRLLSHQKNVEKVHVDEPTRELFLAEWRNTWDARAAARVIGVPLTQLRKLRELDAGFAEAWSEVESDRIAMLRSFVTTAIEQCGIDPVLDDTGQVVGHKVNWNAVRAAQKDLASYDPEHLDSKKVPGTQRGDVKVIIDMGAGGAPPQTITVQEPDGKRQKLSVSHRSTDDEFDYVEAESVPEQDDEPEATLESPSPSPLAAKVNGEWDF